MYDLHTQKMDNFDQIHPIRQLGYPKNDKEAHNQERCQWEVGKSNPYFGIKSSSTS